MNNPNRKSIYTPYGEFMSSEEFEKKTKMITANALRGIMHASDTPISKRRALRAPIFSIADVGKTPRELGWHYA